MHQSVTITIAAAVGAELLKTRGWTREPVGAWIAPDGARYWQMDEALMVALTAEGTPQAEAVAS